MANGMTIWRAVVVLLRRYVQPVQRAASQGDDGIARLVTAVVGPAGASPQAQDIAAIQALASVIADFDTTWSASSGNVVDLDTFGNLVRDLVTALQAFSGGPGGLSAALVGPMAEYLLSAVINDVSPVSHSMLRLLGVIDGSKPRGQQFVWDRLQYLFAPAEILPNVYGWGSSTFNSRVLLENIGYAAASLGATLEFS